MEALSDEVGTLSSSREKVFKTPPIEWIAERLGNLKELLERRIPQSTQVLRNLLGTIRLEPVTPDISRPFYRAITTLDALALIETPSGSAEGGSNSLEKVETPGFEPGSAVV